MAEDTERLAVIQMRSGSAVSDNFERAAELLAAAADRGARLAVLPENFALMPNSEGDRLAAAEADGDGPIQTFLAAQAAQHRMWIIGGSVPLAGTAADRVFAASLVYDARGTRVARYDKIHLFDVELDSGESYRESEYIQAGAPDQAVVVDTPCGRVGLSVCYDLRFPELYRRLSDLGAELLCVPSAFTWATGRVHWEVLLRARAVENLAFVVAPAQHGLHENGRRTFGHSMIIGPWGDILATLADADGVAVAEVDREALTRLRQRFPSLAHRCIVGPETP
ncbi:MAG: carbon-nitrogen hydrolase family protein [Gammaproteobacteria bacterium]|nr:carbon-nitrogen hydrolase family protein [Gammaproteobacteria bacterium]